MNTVIIVTSIIASTILLMHIVGWLQNSHYYQCYRETYESLPSKKFYRNGNQVYDWNYGRDDNGFVYFIEQGSFRLNRIVYMKSDSLAIDFYQWYWRKKMVKWFQDNVNIDELPEYEYLKPRTRGGKFRCSQPLIEQE